MLRKIYKNILTTSKDQSGASLIEFALVAPIYFLVVIGGIEFMTVIWEQYSLNYIISKGARYAYINRESTEAEVIDYMANSDIPLPNSPTYTVTIEPFEDATITGTIDHQFIFYPSQTYKIQVSIVQPLSPT